LEYLRGQINKPFFMEIIVLISWAIWMSRNKEIFNNTAATIQGCKAIFRHEFSSLLWRAKNYFPEIQEWLQNLV
jgi:hypothetical protein